jgi:hypothetical protein
MSLRDVHEMFLCQKGDKPATSKPTFHIQPATGSPSTLPPTSPQRKRVNLRRRPR